MPLNPPVPGLRAPVRMRQNSSQVAKVQVHVQPGDVLEVSDDVADQIVAARAGFVVDGTDDKADQVVARAVAAAESERVSRNEDKSEHDGTDGASPALRAPKRGGRKPKS